MWRFRATTCLLAIITGLIAINPALQIEGIRDFKRTNAQYGPLLPEYALVPIERVVLFLGCSLIGSAVLVLFAPRFGTTIAALASPLSWIYFGPQLWAFVRGDGCFDFSGHCIGVSWPVLGVLAGATAYFILCSLKITTSRKVY